MDIPLFIIFLALFLSGCALVVFTVLIVSIRTEDRRMSMARAPRTPIEGMSRRLLGTHAHRCSDPALCDVRR
ncbi:hypothetical protein [Streptosporangium sp. V21-05]|uniref:hypothetical protein n=1 Tax=Streptosporangium sp. V21-05 TaxID=3446115 RepID=UPI003F52F665